MLHDLGGGAVIRQATEADHPALYDICLKTGDAGRDATPLYDDPKLLGDFYAVPYQVLEPEFALMLETEGKALGYVLGALDSQAFYDRMCSEWLPAHRGRVRDPGPEPALWGPGDWLRRKFHHPDFPAYAALAPYPSHGHIDLLPEAQGRGWGGALMRVLMQKLAAAGSPGIHLGVAPSNRGAQAFYQRLGFRRLRAAAIPEDAVIMARVLRVASATPDR